MAVNFSKTFLFRKLHQLTGIVPLGVFFLEHMYTNSKAVAGAEAYNEAVQDLQAIPYVLFLEIGGIFLPLIYHAVYGLFITMETRPNNLNYPYARNWFYTLQRTTGTILFFFLFFHVLNFRFGLIPGLNEMSVAHYPDQAFQIVAREFQIPSILALYFVGITATVMHFAQGIWLFMLDWGIVIGARAQRLALYACAGIGAILLAVSLNAAVAFVKPGGIFAGLI